VSAVVVVAVLGLGEAGSEIAADLVAAGAEVRGYDPVVEGSGVPGIVVCGSEAEAVAGAELVFSVNSAADAADATRAGAAACADRIVWADLNTASPGRKQELAGLLPEPVAFADVAMMSTVPGKGLRVPMVASGPGAARFAELAVPLGASVEVLADAPVGEAARRKLLRSVFFKGMSAAVTEAVAAASVYGLEEFVRAEITREFERLDADMLARIEDGSRRHAVRRSHEMDAAVEMLASIDVPPRVSSAARDWLRQLAD